ncbi:MAG: hypothetical protein WDW38_001055 [Sanguina aurantia]
MLVPTRPSTHPVQLSACPPIRSPFAERSAHPPIRFPYPSESPPLSCHQPFHPASHGPAPDLRGPAAHLREVDLRQQALVVGQRHPFAERSPLQPLDVGRLPRDVVTPEQALLLLQETADACAAWSSTLQAPSEDV